MPKGQGRRCWGFLSDGGEWARCTRPELAGNAPDRGGYVHKTTGKCACGSSHGNWIPPLPVMKPPNDNRDYALKIWEQGVHIEGTLAEKYLRSRAIKIELPPYLRFHPELRHTDTDTYHPALLAAVTVDSPEIVAVQRTYLSKDGTGKSAISPNKMTIGSSLRGSVKLDMPGRFIALAEGVETALSVQQQTNLPTWAVLGSKNIPNVHLPDLPQASRVSIFSDGDDDGRDACAKAGDRFHFEGRECVIVPAPEGKDWNDVSVEEEVAKNAKDY